MASTRRALAGVLLLFLVLAAGLGWWYWRGRTGSRSASSAAAPARGGELIVALRGDPAAYNRYVEATTYADLLTTLTDAKLVRLNRASDELEPWLAESWTRSDDGLRYTLKLRPDVKFSDGTPFTSADVLFSFRALYDERVKSPLASGMLSLSGLTLAPMWPPKVCGTRRKCPRIHWCI